MSTALSQTDQTIGLMPNNEQYKFLLAPSYLMIHESFSRKCELNIIMLLHTIIKLIIQTRRKAIQDTFWTEGV